MKVFRLLVLCGAFLAISACGGPKNLFVLMPDTAGNVGRITVENKGGRQVIATAETGVRVKDAQTSPAAPQPIPKKDIEKTFKGAMQAAPQPSARFILYFQAGTTQLTDTSQALVPRIVATVHKRTPCDVQIIGHTDTAGNAEKNWKLGLRRAENVKKILIGQGVSADQLEATSHGEKDLIFPTPDNVSEPKNRCVEVRVR